MRKITLVCLACAFLFSTTAIAQNTTTSNGSAQGTSKTHPAKTKAVSLFGKVSDDGKTIVSAKHHNLFVSNPDALMGYAGHRIAVKGLLETATNTIRVTSVKKLADEVRYVANLSDSAFRR